MTELNSVMDLIDFLRKRNSPVLVASTSAYLGELIYVDQPFRHTVGKVSWVYGGDRLVVEVGGVSTDLSMYFGTRAAVLTHPEWVRDVSRNLSAIYWLVKMLQSATVHLPHGCRLVLDEEQEQFVLSKGLVTGSPQCDSYRKKIGGKVSAANKLNFGITDPEGWWDRVSITGDIGYLRQAATWTLGTTPGYFRKSPFRYSLSKTSGAELVQVALGGTHVSPVDRETLEQVKTLLRAVQTGERGIWCVYDIRFEITADDVFTATNLADWREVYISSSDWNHGVVISEEKRITTLVRAVGACFLARRLASGSHRVLLNGLYFRNSGDGMTVQICDGSGLYVPIEKVEWENLGGTDKERLEFAVLGGFADGYAGEFTHSNLDCFQDAISSQSMRGLGAFTAAVCSREREPGVALNNYIGGVTEFGGRGAYTLPAHAPESQAYQEVRHAIGNYMIETAAIGDTVSFEVTKEHRLSVMYTRENVSTVVHLDDYITVIDEGYDNLPSWATTLINVISADFFLRCLNGTGPKNTARINYVDIDLSRADGVPVALNGGGTEVELPRDVLVGGFSGLSRLTDGMSTQQIWCELVINRNIPLLISLAMDSRA